MLVVGARDGGVMEGCGHGVSLYEGQDECVVKSVYSRVRSRDIYMARPAKPPRLR